MKTATQYTEEVLADRKKITEEKEARVKEFLHTMEMLKPAQEGSDLHGIREGVRSGKYHLRGIMCDKCGFELVSNGSQNLSNPPTITHICCKCEARYLIP
jgi:formylmethanofuran dehydrogenase subunit E